MFARKLRIEYIDPSGAEILCPVRWIDSFSMRNFTNDAIFDDTLPLEDGLLEAGSFVPLDQLREKMQEWFLRKSYLKPGQTLRITELPRTARTPRQTGTDEIAGA